MNKVYEEKADFVYETAKNWFPISGAAFRYISTNEFIRHRDFVWNKNSVIYCIYIKKNFMSNNCWTIVNAYMWYFSINRRDDIKVVNYVYVTIWQQFISKSTTTLYGFN